jgi:hypothetical protein
LIARWAPDRDLFFVGDSSFAPRMKGARRPSPQQALDNRKTKWTKIEIDNWYGGQKREVKVYTETAVWYCCRNLPVPTRWVLIRNRLGEFDPQAPLSTNLDHTPLQILSWFVRRWRMEVTFEEARAHMGIDTQRQWNELAIARTTPALFRLFSIVTLMADQLIKGEVKPVRTAAWYEIQKPTFADAIAIVRRCLWSNCHFSTSGQNKDVVIVPRVLFERLTDAVCYARERIKSRLETISKRKVTTSCCYGKVLARSGKRRYQSKAQANRS